MFTWEIYKFLQDRNYYVGGDDLEKITSIIENPQLVHIKYDAFENKYKMWDFEGNYIEFTPMPYEEAKAKKLIKGR